MQVNAPFGTIVLIFTLILVYSSQNLQAIQTDEMHFVAGRPTKSCFTVSDASHDLIY